MAWKDLTDEEQLSLYDSGMWVWLSTVVILFTLSCMLNNTTLFVVGASMLVAVALPFTVMGLFCVITGILGSSGRTLANLRILFFGRKN